MLKRPCASIWGQNENPKKATTTKNLSVTSFKIQ